MNHRELMVHASNLATVWASESTQNNNSFSHLSLWSLSLSGNTKVKVNDRTFRSKELYSIFAYSTKIFFLWCLLNAKNCSRSESKNGKQKKHRLCPPEACILAVESVNRQSTNKISAVLFVCLFSSFSIMVYLRMLNTVPCVYSRPLLFAHLVL